MKAGSDDVDNAASENQRYGRNKSTLVNKAYINSGEYRRKFDKLTNNAEINKTLYQIAKTALYHRSGTIIEDMYWIDKNTGEIAAKVVDLPETVTSHIPYSPNIIKAIKGRSGLITVHTHPESFPPSVHDLNSAFHNGYDMGIVLCHDGKIFAYKSREEINITLNDLYIAAGRKEGLNEYEAQISALNKMKKNFSFDFWEVE